MNQKLEMSFWNCKGEGGGRGCGKMKDRIGKGATEKGGPGMGRISLFNDINFWLFHMF